mgnify:CR=1 FL=1
MYLSALSRSARVSSASFTVESSFAHAINLREASGALMTLVTCGKPLPPQGIKVDCPQFPEIDLGNRATFRQGVLTLFGNTPLSIDVTHAQVIDLTAGRIAPDAARVRLALERYLHIETEPASSTLWPVASAPHSRTGLDCLCARPWLAARAAQVRAGALDNLVAELIGLGPGLTPSGDDFLCGWLWWATLAKRAELAPLRVAVLKHLTATTPISQSLLIAASNGVFLESLKVAELDPDAGFSSLAQQGHSSGMDTLAGIAFALMFVDALAL